LNSGGIPMRDGIIYEEEVPDIDEDDGPDSDLDLYIDIGKLLNIEDEYSGLLIY
jgi:hypothetical protein